MSGLMRWAIVNRPDLQLFLVHPKNDNQVKVYPEAEELNQLSYRDRFIKAPIAFMYIFRALMTSVYVRPKLKKGDGLLASSHFLPDVIPIALANKHATKTVFIHHIVRDTPRKRGFLNFLADLQETFCFFLIKRRFDKIVVVNNEVHDRLREMGFRKEILISSNFIVENKTKPATFNTRKIDVVFCGRLMKQKGVFDFIEICEKLAEQIKNFSAVMIGKGPEAAKLKSMIADKKLNIELKGYVDEYTKANIVAQSKVFLFPSIEEGWGIVIAESLSAGTPVTTYDLSVYKHIFENHIYTVPIHDAHSLYTKTADILSKSDEKKYNEHSKIIANFAQKFSIDKIAKNEWNFIASKV